MHSSKSSSKYIPRFICFRQSVFAVSRSNQAAEWAK